MIDHLVKLYKKMEEKGLVRYDWSRVLVHYIFNLDEEGNVTDVIYSPQEMEVPVPAQKSSDIRPSFLCDKANYMLGVGDGKNESRIAKSHKACKEFHTDILKEVNHPAARSLIRFFEKWEPEKAKNLVLGHKQEGTEKQWNEFVSTDKIVFLYDGKEYLHEIPEIRKAWNCYCRKEAADKKKMKCIITGEVLPIARIHPKIKVPGGKSTMGISLVSFNKECLESYGKKKGMNAPMGDYTTFAYTTALNYLLENYAVTLGNFRIVSWTSEMDENYQDLASSFLFEKKSAYTNEDIYAIVKKLTSGKPVQYNSGMLDPDMEFYVLGIQENAGRGAIKFFYKNSFGNFMRNCEEHFQRMELFSVFNNNASVRSILESMENPHRSDNSFREVLYGELMQSILFGRKYPASVFNGIMYRISVDRKITYTRAAFIKAYFMKNGFNLDKEVLSVSLNENCSDVSYILGRILAVADQIQYYYDKEASRKISDQFLRSASQTPSRAFPIILQKMLIYLKSISKKDKGLGIALEKKLMQMTAEIGTSFPDYLTSQQKGAFYLGFFAQREENYRIAAEKKEMSKDEEENNV